ncbi:MraY family glycosyltransferase [Mucilaginibacter sp. X5P1]|uniref:MraY family glycosyltransferase n=1 Tax=Mucilaginibacter sp. X5P1 TaxID=2723088 RepID=UPI00161A1118|nr:MraY family glycosyltransferase [Mucilaginibacter sp. X5P1]MBB6140800.1 UDP-N-acetylmuramyl pentapeptide phosphotransferase/UDP-N-acetylglucosamine-1-phosphate transferase [Mucilaginibacter sp. X5P1]
MLLHSYPCIICLLIVLSSAIITCLIIPRIIDAAHIHQIYDILGNCRKHHDEGIPRLGGVAIFISFIVSFLLPSLPGEKLNINYLLCGFIIIFALGLIDDLAGVTARTKFIIQFIAAFILVIPGDIRISNMYGFLGIYELPYVLSSLLTIFLIMLVVNAFNLIDGIDGLAATTGIFVNGTLGLLFIYMGQYELAALPLSLVGALIGFLKFNITPAKIFMGDTGSLLIGLVSIISAIKFIEVNKFINSSPLRVYSAPLLIIALLMGPVFDTIRVMVIRITKGISPFTADRNHNHHRMLKIGFNHLQTTIVFAILNAISIAIVLFWDGISSSFLLCYVFLTYLFFNGFLTFTIRFKQRSLTS